MYRGTVGRHSQCAEKRQTKDKVCDMQTFCDSEQLLHLIHICIHA